MTGNKGDWGEFYAFLKILTDKKIYSADADLNIIPDSSFIVLSVLRKDQTKGDILYDVSNSNDELHLAKENNSTEIIELKELKKSVAKIFNEIMTSAGASFEIDSAKEIIQTLHCSKIKAEAKDKADLLIQVHDGFTPQKSRLGFSVKSQFGNPATLVNASVHTNFIYEIKDWSATKKEIKQINELAPPKGKIRARIEKIREKGGQLEFSAMMSRNFKRNLIKVDSALPEILAEMVLDYFSGEGSRIESVTKRLEQNRYLRRMYDLVEEDFAYKVKQFLGAYALGMVASTKWDGLTKAQGGYLIVKEDGTIVCYHLYNKDEFQEYLFKNTKFDTGSSTKHKFGTIYQEEDRFFINLNLQVRFIK